MKNRLSISWVKTLAHVVGWIVFMFAPVILSPGRDLDLYFTEPRLLTSLFARNGLLIILFYLNYFLIAPRFFHTRKLAIYSVLLAILMIAIGTANYFIHESINGPFRGDGTFHAQPPGEFRHPPDEFGRPGPPRLMLAGPFYSSLLLSALVGLASMFLVLYDNWEKAKADEQERTIQKVAAELAMLKLQISPHFLFNTLNNIRWLVRSKSDNAEAALVKLSQLMRYILYQANATYVTLEKEIQHLRDYIVLQKMRLPENVEIDFSVKGDAQDKNIVPLLLIPLVENFFKHGDFREDVTSGIHLKVMNHTLTFNTVNKLRETQVDKELNESSGIGIENVGKRLMLHYPGKHELAYHKENSYYFLTLTIILN
jgi:hypothetical protein